MKATKTRVLVFTFLSLSALFTHQKVWAHENTLNIYNMESSTDTMNYIRYADDFFTKQKYHAARVMYELASFNQPGDSTIESRLQFCHFINKKHEIEKSASENYLQIVEEAYLLFDIGRYEFALELFEYASELDSDDQAYLEGIQRCEKALFKAMEKEKNDKQ